MRFTGYVTAGEFDVFSPDMKMTPAGSPVMVALPNGERVEGKLISAERVSESRIRVTVEVPGEIEGLVRDRSPLRFRQDCR